MGTYGTQWADAHLACKWPWVQHPGLLKKGTMAHACDPSIQEVEVKAGWSELQGHLQLHGVWACEVWDM